MSVLEYRRTDSANLGFQRLVRLLDADLKVRDGEDHAFFAQFNKTAALKYVVVWYYDATAVGCGALKEYSADKAEVKRMYTADDYRGQGVATAILAELEKWATELGYEGLVLETGEKQPEAIALYKKNNYKVIPNYGQYENVPSSVCFSKKLR